MASLDSSLPGQPGVSSPLLTIVAQPLPVTTQPLPVTTQLLPGIIITPGAAPVGPQSSSSTTLLPPGVPAPSSFTAPVTSITPIESSPSISSENKTSTSQKSPTSSPTASRPHTSTSTSAGQTRASGAPTHDRGLSNGVVAGIAIAVGLGLALATFIATFLIMRRRRTSGHKKYHRRSKEQAGSTLGEPIELPVTENLPSEPGELPVTKSPRISSTYEKYLPQSADDKTIQNSVKTMLDQVEIYVDNFYRNDSGLSGLRPGADVDVYNSPDLPSSLASLLAQSRHSTVLIKHALAQCVTSSISPRSRTDSSLLPDEFMLIATADEATGNQERARPGYDQCLSRWRVLTAYLRPSPSQDPVYLAQRDQRIAHKVERFSRDFAPWKNNNHEDASRNRSLSAIFRSAADLGIFVFSQPSEIRFQWPRQSETGATNIAVTPSLIKTTDQSGQPLAKSQVMLKAVIEKI